MAPMASRIANRQKNRLVFLTRFLECCFAPGQPIHGVMRVLAQIRAFFMDERVRIHGAFSLASRKVSRLHYSPTAGTFIISRYGETGIRSRHYTAVRWGDSASCEPRWQVQCKAERRDLARCAPLSISHQHVLARLLPDPDRGFFDCQPRLYRTLSCNRNRAA